MMNARARTVCTMRCQPTHIQIYQQTATTTHGMADRCSRAKASEHLVRYGLAIG